MGHLHVSPDLGASDSEFDGHVAAVEKAAREFSVRWDEPEGRFVEALLAVMRRLAQLTAATKASMEATARQAHATTVAELESVRELRRTVEGLKVQTHAVQMLSAAERENAVQRMIERTLPLFAERLQGALVVREARWNTNRAHRRYALAGSVLLGAFLSGFAVCAWAQRDQVRLAGRCLEAVVQTGGHTYCLLEQALAPPPPSLGASSEHRPP